MKLRLKEQTSETTGSQNFYFEPEEPLSWQAGQYLHYVLAHDNPDDRGRERWFTISSAPYEKNVRITTRIDHDKGSTFKKTLLAMKPGDEIEADGPKGSFVVEDTAKNYVFVAGGIGITPFRSIFKELDHEGKDFTVELLYANRSEADIPFKEELEEIAKKHSNFHITYFIDDNKINQKALEEYGAKLKDPHYYISGPEPMVKVFEETLKQMGVDEEHYKRDSFPGYERE